MIFRNVMIARKLILCNFVYFNYRFVLQMGPVQQQATLGQEGDSCKLDTTLPMELLHFSRVAQTLLT